MKNNILYTITDKQIVDDLQKEGIKNFLFPFKDYCVGYPKTFSMNDVPKNAYLLINRILDSKAIVSLIEKIDFTIIRGLVVEDLGIYTLLKEHKIKTELILNQQHFNTNIMTINEQLKIFSSVVISSDITKKQIMNILDLANKPLCITAFGLNQVMYSRRNLLTNFQQQYHLKTNKIVNLQEKITKKEFIAMENDFGTVFYYANYYNALALNHPNILYKIINPVLMSVEDQIVLIEAIQQNKEITHVKVDEGFLHTQTIYRVKGKSYE